MKLSYLHNYSNHSNFQRLYLYQATVQFNDGTSECLVHSEGPSVFEFLKKPHKLSEWKILKDKMEGGCHQYGSVRYDSYFSHWNRLDRLNSWTDADDLFVEEDEENNYSLPYSYDTENTVKKAMPNNYNNNYDHASYKKNDKRDDPDSKNNFYKFLSPAHKEEKLLENYINDQSTTSTLKLQVKIIIEKSEKLQSQSQSFKKEIIETVDKKNEDHNDKIISDIEKNKLEVNNTTPLENLIRSVNNYDDVSINARNIKAQENNDDRSHAISFVSLPTLSYRSLTLEAVSVVLIEKNEIRSEAWKELEVIKLKFNTRKR